jgi:hypothetical protein
MYRASGIGISLVLIAAGGVLAWAVTTDANGVNLHNVGLILFFVGLAGLVVSLLLAAVPRRVHDSTVVDRGVPDRRVIERDRVQY